MYSCRIVIDEPEWVRYSLSGFTDYVRIDSVPQGAKVTTTIETLESRRRSQRDILAKRDYKGCPATPCAIEVGRRQKFAITLEHKGYEPAEIGMRGDIKMQTIGVDMTSTASSMGTGIASGVAMGALAGSFEVAAAQFASQLTSVFTFGLVNTPAHTSGVVANATSSGAAIGVGVGVGMIGVDVMSGAYEQQYPNPIIVKLAPKGSPTVIDPNMIMFKLREAKKRTARRYCGSVHYDVSKKKHDKNCRLAKEIDKQRDIDNAELLSHEDDIKKMVRDLNRKIKAKRAEARRVRNAAD